METIIIQIKKKFESKALEIIQNQQEKQNSQNSPPIDLFNNLVNRFQKQVNKFNKPDFEHDFNPEDGILMRDNEGVLLITTSIQLPKIPLHHSFITL
ncbi:hypothetical protein AB6H26_05325 [Providencia hangzhouensis]|uniref:hypothetical protein n=1 Tax=Providencia hangzhouensis TaxID=3031799 RepID=UPI0034DD12C4